MAVRIKKKNIVNFDEVNKVWNIEAVVMCDSDADLPDADAFAGYNLVLGSLCIDASTGDKYWMDSSGTWNKDESGSGGGGGGGGGGGDTPTETPTVKFIDYDGTVLHTYTKDEFNALTEMPANPSHEGLVAQGWNWGIENAKAKISNDESVNIGQMYTTSDGKTRIYIELTDGRLEPLLQLNLNGTATIDWGDGTNTDTISGSSLSSAVSKQHVYSNAGEYIILIDVIGEATILGSQYASKLISKSTLNASYIDNVYCNTIKFINIGSNISSLNNYAFQNCYSLTSITIPDTVTIIGASAFTNCYSLTSITIPDTVTSIGNSAFSSCYSLESIIIPDTVTSIGSSAFSSCRALTSITIPDTVTSIGASAFQTCYSLTSITIPDTVTSIGASAFTSCSSLASITISDTVTSIGNNAFSSCSVLRSITIPDTVTSIGASAFQSCYSLTSITIPDTVTSIGNSAFSSCYSLESIIIPDTVTIIGASTFSSCSSLASITISDTVTSVGKSAFSSCSSLASITIPDTVTSIDAAAFQYCYGLGYIKFESSTPPTVANSNAWLSVQSDCKIYVPSGSLSAYKSATNYPNPNTYTYVEY